MQPTPDEIRGQLGRILASDTFASSGRLRRFLQYVVERTLAGEGDRLKEYLIGVEVFDRGDQYDPRLDSIVRVEAGRLRARIDEYYAGPGVDDGVIIRLRRGSYAPVIERRTVTAVTPPPEGPLASPLVKPAKRSLWPAAALAVLVLASIALWRADIGEPGGTQPPVTIAVLPFANYSTDEAVALLAARVTDGVTSELARIGTLGVVSHTSALQFAGMRRPLRETARALNADVVMEARLLIDGDRLRVEARLVDAALDRKFWVEDFVGTVADVRELERRIATSVTAAVVSRRHRLPDDRLP